MTKTEAVIRSILGAVRADIRPLACAVDIAVDLMFIRGIPMDDIYVEAAKNFNKMSVASYSAKTVSRRIERLSNLCWDTVVSRGLVTEYIGAPIRDIHAPRDMIFYLAFYVYFDAPFFAVIRQRPALLF